MDILNLNEWSPSEFSVEVKIENTESDQDESPEARTFKSEEKAKISTLSNMHLINDMGTLKVKLTRLPSNLINQYTKRNKCKTAGLLPTNNNVSRKTAAKYKRVENIAADIKLISHNDKNYIPRKERKINAKDNENDLNVIKENSDVLPDYIIEFKKNVSYKSTAFPGDEYSCPRCKYTTKNYNSFHWHLKAHSSPEQFVCDTCHYIGTSKVHIKRHLKVHSDEHSFVCVICDKTFMSKDSLTGHMRMHKNERPYACQMCDKTFYQTSHLNAHKKTHTGEKPHACNFCPMKFGRRNLLTDHILTNHTNIEKAYACDICDKKFTLKPHLKSHLRRHTGENSVACDICDAVLSGSDKLNRHLKIHTKDKPYPCKECNKKFGRREHLRRHLKTHMKIHDTEKRFFCGICDKKFCSRNELNSHISTHKKPYVCRVCGAQFKTKYKMHFRKCLATLT